MEKNIKIRIIDGNYNYKYIMINKDQLNLLNWLCDHDFLSITYVEEENTVYEII